MGSLIREKILLSVWLALGRQENIVRYNLFVTVVTNVLLYINSTVISQRQIARIDHPKYSFVPEPDGLRIYKYSGFDQEKISHYQRTGILGNPNFVKNLLRRDIARSVLLKVETLKITVCL